MEFDVSRDYLDGILLQQLPSRDGKGEIKASGNLHFLPSSPDGTMHTAIVSFALSIDGTEHPFARAGWRFLFTTDSACDPKAMAQHAFFRHLLQAGIGKIMVQVNNLCMHANLPLIPFDPTRMSPQVAQAGGAVGAPPTPPAQA